MDITRSGAEPSGREPAGWFAGSVRVDPMQAPPGPGRTILVPVTFEPGSRRGWHTRPLGRTLVVTAGPGLTAHH